MAIVMAGRSRWSIGSVMIFADVLAADADRCRLPESPICRVLMIEAHAVIDVAKLAASYFTFSIARMRVCSCCLVRAFIGLTAPDHWDLVLLVHAHML